MVGAISARALVVRRARWRPLSLAQADQVDLYQSLEWSSSQFPGPGAAGGTLLKPNAFRWACFGSWRRASGNATVRLIFQINCQAAPARTKASQPVGTQAPFECFRPLALTAQRHQVKLETCQWAATTHLHRSPVRHPHAASSREPVKLIRVVSGCVGAASQAHRLRDWCAPLGAPGARAHIWRAHTDWKIYEIPRPRDWS